MSAFRQGLGFDAHRFEDADGARPFMLAALQWEGPALAGDSDGDVVAHAVIDAVLSAAHLGDIGTLFGVGAHSSGAGMSGRDMLAATMDHLRAHGCTPNSIAVSVIGNRPKIAPRRLQAERVLSEICGCQVSLTATTTDGMGFTGRGEGVAALATALVEVGPDAS